MMSLAPAATAGPGPSFATAPARAGAPNAPCAPPATCGAWRSAGPHRTRARPQMRAALSFRRLGSSNPRRPEDEFVSFLPLAWIGEQMMSLATALAIGFAVNFPEEPETAQENIREIGPHLLFGPPRFWEGLTSRVQVKIMDTTPFKRLMYQRLMPVGHRISRFRLEGKPVPAVWPMPQALAWPPPLPRPQDPPG